MPNKNDTAQESTVNNVTGSGGDIVEDIVDMEEEEEDDEDVEDVRVGGEVPVDVLRVLFAHQTKKERKEALKLVALLHR